MFIYELTNTGLGIRSVFIMANTMTDYFKLQRFGRKSSIMEGGEDMKFMHIKNLFWGKYCFPVMVDKDNKEVKLNNNEAIEYLKQGYIGLIDSENSQKYYKWADGELYSMIPFHIDCSPWKRERHVKVEPGLLLCHSEDVHKTFPFFC